MNSGWGFWTKLFRDEKPSPSPPTERELKKVSPEPWADLQFTDGKLQVIDFNEAFVKKLRSQFGDLVDETTSDEDVVKLYIDRENIQREEPRLEILHMGIEENGQLKISLDWNKAFIDHLKKNGITGETEEEAIKEYLSRLTTQTADEQGEIEDVLTREQINEAFRSIDVELEQEFKIAETQAKKRRRITKK